MTFDDMIVEIARRVREKHGTEATKGEITGFLAGLVQDVNTAWNWRTERGPWGLQSTHGRRAGYTTEIAHGTDGYAATVWRDGVDIGWGSADCLEDAKEFARETAERDEQGRSEEKLWVWSEVGGVTLGHCGEFKVVVREDGKQVDLYRRGTLLSSSPVDSHGHGKAVAVEYIEYVLEGLL